MFVDKLRKEASGNSVVVVFPESSDARIVEAACIAGKKNYCTPILLGNEAAIKKLGAKIGCSLNHVIIIDHLKSDEREEYAERLAEKRKKKGLTYKDALKLMDNANYFGGMMVECRDADGLITGAVGTTAQTVRSAIHTVGVAQGKKWVSGACFCMHKEKMLLLADCAVIEQPTSEQLCHIAIDSAETYEFFAGKKAKVALLSFSTKGSASHEMLDRIRKAVVMIRKKKPGLVVDGELQVDAALRPDVAKRKCPQSPIKGDANVLVFPNLDAGNISLKFLNILAGYEIVGPFLQSVSKPVNDLSRGCYVKDVVDMTVFMSVQVRRLRKKK
ncbi:MAG: phosphate [Chitinophagaceae bacterium]|nr:MAG: phosphate [Chitinophagaceae bacterium]